MRPRLCLSLFLVGFAARAYPQTGTDLERARGNPLGRILGSFTPPPISTGSGRRDDCLQALVRDGKLPLSEADAVRLALENNVDINVERYAPYFSLWGIEKGRAVLNPSVALTTNLNRLVTPTSSVLEGGDTLFNLTTLYDFTVHKPFESGLDFDLNFTTRRLRSDSFFYSINPSLSSTLNLSFTQHLLKDFGRISRGRFLRVARTNYNMAEEEFATRVSDVLVSALGAYWDLVFLDQDIRVKEDSLKLAQVVLEQNRVQASVGTMAALDVVQAEAEVAARNEQLVAAQYNRRIVEDQLKKLISSRPDPGVIAAEVVPTTEPSPPPAPSEVGEAVARALEVRPEVKRLELELENRSVQVEYARNQVRPTLDFVASFSQNGIGGTRINRDFSRTLIGAPILSVEPGGFRDTLGQLFGGRFLGYAFGFNLLLPLGNDEARASSAQARIEHSRTEERLRSVRQRLAVEVREAHHRMARERARVAAAEATVHYGEERLRAEQDKHSVGEGTTRAVLEAQRDLEDARSRLARAKTDLVKSRVALDRSTGSLLA
ncbi:MAG: hypothetical protein DMG07_12970, partial [Acidobacteria bacterium]